MCKHIAVYGTLRRGGPANGYLDGATFKQQSTIPARLYTVGWFPGIKLDNEAATVVDVYELPEGDPRFLDGMDRYEGYRAGRPEESLFNREKILCEEMNEEVFVYTYNHDVDEERRIHTGDWFDAPF